MPHHSCFGAMKEQVVCHFLCTFAQVTPNLPLLLSWLTVRILPQDASQAKKLTFKGAQAFHTMLARKGTL